MISMKASQKLRRYSSLVGFNPISLLKTLRGMPSYISDFLKLKHQFKKINVMGGGNFPIQLCYPMLNDKFSEAGTTSGDYFHQDLLVARKIFLANPERHVDIGSRTDGFVAHVAVFREIEVFDVRAVKSSVKNIVFRQADLMRLPEEMKSCCDSVSALHSIEHFGLGRYGDPIDCSGHIKAIRNVTAILKPKGAFYFSVPIGTQRIEFNAHRVFSVQYLWGLLKESYDLLSFSYVDDDGELHENVEFAEDAIKRNFGCEYSRTNGCGIFELKRK
jgi:SAM-dependent methyltransferase